MRLGTNVPERKRNRITMPIGEQYVIIKTNGASALLPKRKLGDLVVHQKKKEISDDYLLDLKATSARFSHYR